MDLETLANNRHITEDKKCNTAPDYSIHIQYSKKL
jgi:hypothetical protein